MFIGLSPSQFVSYFLYNNTNARSSRPEVFRKEGVIRNFTKFTEKHQCQSLLFNKVTGLQLY